MMYPFLTLQDDTEITHSEMKADGRVESLYRNTRRKGVFQACHLLSPGISMGRYL